MVGGNFQRFVHALTDGNAGHHDDELAPTVARVHLKDALDVAVGLAGAGFHFDIEVNLAPCTRHQRVGQRQILPSLDGMNIFDELSIGQLDIGVFKTRIGLYCTADGFSLDDPTRINPICNARGIDLPGKAIDDGLNRAGLIGLDFELQLHTKHPLYRLHVGARRHLFEYLFDVDFDGIGVEAVVTENDS